MKYLILLIAASLFYYLIGAFIYASFNSALWEREGKITLSVLFGFTSFCLTIYTLFLHHNKEI